MVTDFEQVDNGFFFRVDDTWHADEIAGFGYLN